MKLSYFQKAKILLVIASLIIFFAIIATPHYIEGGLLWVPEDVIEGGLLIVELVILVLVFRYYDDHARKNEKEAANLNLKLEKKEKELLSAFEYLGKVNVQVSMIRSLLETMKTPSTRGQLREAYDEVLKVALNITKEDWAIIRIVNLQNGRTLSEHKNDDGLKEEGENERAVPGNNELIEKFEKKNKNNFKKWQIFFSDTDNFYIKAFIFIPDGKNEKIGSQERKLLEAMANQCEMIFLLFNSRYFKAGEGKEALKKQKKTNSK